MKGRDSATEEPNKTAGETTSSLYPQTTEMTCIEFPGILQEKAPSVPADERGDFLLLGQLADKLILTWTTLAEPQSSLNNVKQKRRREKQQRRREKGPNLEKGYFQSGEWERVEQKLNI